MQNPGYAIVGNASGIGVRRIRIAYSFFY